MAPTLVVESTDESRGAQALKFAGAALDLAIPVAGAVPGIPVQEFLQLARSVITAFEVESSKFLTTCTLILILTLREDVNLSGRDF